MATGTKRKAQSPSGRDEGASADESRTARADGGAGGGQALAESALPESLRGGRENAYPRGNVRGQNALKSVNEVQLAQGLGWFSIGLGLAEFLTPRGVAKIAGLPGRNTGFIRLMGLREIAHGVAILSTGGKSAAAVWSRVAGDALDIAALGMQFASPETNKGRLAFATANVLGVTALDVLAAQRLTETHGEGAEERGAKHITKSIIINAEPEELYGLWRPLQNLPRYMRHLELVTDEGGGRSHWVARAPGGSTVEWDAEITEDRPNELIAWRSIEGSQVYNAGSVRFERAPGGRGTVLTVDLDYTPPGGLAGVLAATLAGEEPAGQLQEDLRRFKQVIEVGEVVVSDATLPGTGYMEQRPAQPAE